MLEDFQKLSLRKFKIKSILPDATILCLGRRRSGKCLHKGTPVLMYDGSIRKIENIKVGDVVMGDDSTPRNVLETHNGIDKMYKIINKRGDSYTVNSQHILSLIYSKNKSFNEIKCKNNYEIKWFNKNKLKMSIKTFSYKNKDKNEVYNEAINFFNNLIDDRKIDISIQDYLKLPKYIQNNLMGYQVPIEFPHKDLELNPYILGYWLGDGHKHEACITTQYSNINCYLNYDINGNQVKSILKKYNLTKEKHIPLDYKCNSRENRLKLLAGFIDSDGHLCKDNGFQITQSIQHEKLSDDIIYLARSLGFSANKHTYKGEKQYVKAFRIYINGKGIEEIPTLIPRKQTNPRNCNKNYLVSSIKIEKVQQGEYYGIELDGNNRYVLGNFIVTHNSWLVRDIFYHHRHIPSGVVFSGTEEASPFFSDFIPDSFIHSEYDPELIENIMTRQKKKIRETKISGKSENGKLPSNNVFIVLDDMLHEAQNWKKEKTIKNIFFNGRHFNFLFILTMQYPLGITPELRSNIDYVFVFNEPSIKNRKKIYDDYGSVLPTFDYFCNILDACTQNHECLVIKTSSNSTDVRDQIFWYKAEAHHNFRVGHPKFWKYHGSNYNKHYEEDQENDHFEIEKLKKKFAKTRKLKVIVSRSGEVVDIKNSDSE